MRRPLGPATKPSGSSPALCGAFCWRRRGMTEVLAERKSNGAPGLNRLWRRAHVVPRRVFRGLRCAAARRCALLVGLPGKTMSSAAMPGIPRAPCHAGVVVPWNDLRDGERESRQAVAARSCAGAMPLMRRAAAPPQRYDRSTAAEACAAHQTRNRWPARPCGVPAWSNRTRRRQRCRVPIAGPAVRRVQRRTCSAPGLTILVGVPRMKLTTLSKAAPKYSS